MAQVDIAGVIIPPETTAELAEHYLGREVLLAVQEYLRLHPTTLQFGDDISEEVSSSFMEILHDPLLKSDLPYGQSGYKVTIQWQEDGDNEPIGTIISVSHTVCGREIERPVLDQHTGVTQTLLNLPDFEPFVEKSRSEYLQRTSSV